MNLKTVWYFIFIIVAQWCSIASHRDVDSRSYLPTDSNSRYRCCEGNYRGGHKDFHRQTHNNQQHNYDPSFSKYRQGYHTNSHYQHHHHKDYRPNRQNYFDYKSPPSKYPYTKNYYTRRYNNHEHGSKYMQKRIGFGSPNSYNGNFNGGNGGYRPYVPNQNFQDHRYPDINNRFNDFRYINSNKRYYEPPDDRYQRQKFKPGLLLKTIPLNKSGAVIAIDPDGHKHVIHDLPPWADLNITPPQRGNDLSNLDSTGILEQNGDQRFSTGLQERPSVGLYDEYKDKWLPILTGSNDNSADKDDDSQFVDGYKDSLKYHTSNKYTSDITKQFPGSEIFTEIPIKTDQFRPSTPYLRYSEPDPLYHPNGSPLQTYPPTEKIQITVTPSSIIPEGMVTTSEPKSEKIPDYPDSINAQLPPPSHDTDTRVPYVAATEVTEKTPQVQFTVATQASESTHKKSFIQTMSTKLSENFSEKSEIQTSAPHLEMPKTEKTSLPPTTTPINNILKSVISTTKDEITTLIFTTPMSHIDNNIKTEGFLPTVITEKIQIIPQESHKLQISSSTPKSPQDISTHKTVNLLTLHNSLNETHNSENMKTATKNATEITKKFNKTANLIAVTKTYMQDTSTEVNELELKRTVINFETSTMETRTSETISKSVEKKDSNLLQSSEVNNSDKRSLSKNDSPTHQGVTNMMDTIAVETNKSSKIMAIKPVPFLLNHLHTLINHARTLKHLHHHSNVTNLSSDKKYW